MKATSQLKKVFSLLSFVFFIATTIAHAADKPMDYLLQGKVYQWYGNIDQPNYVVPNKMDIDFKEYKHANRSAGAHHILGITPKAINNGKQVIEVELEYLAKPKSGKEITGQYVVQQLVLDVNNNNVISSKTMLNEYDDFTSNYRDSSNPNLIRAFIYEWTNHIDELSEGKLSDDKNLLAAFRASTVFSAEEKGVDDAEQYFRKVSKQDYKTSRRAIKNLNIQFDKKTRIYSANFEYVWNALNHDGENELAQMGVELEIEFINGKIYIRSYKAKYLPPVTDLGAEIRC